MWHHLVSGLESSNSSSSSSFSVFFFFNFISYEFQVGNTTYFHDPCGPHDYTDTFFSFLLIFHAKKQLRMLLHLHL